MSAPPAAYRLPLYLYYKESKQLEHLSSRFFYLLISQPTPLRPTFKFKLLDRMSGELKITLPPIQSGGYGDFFLHPRRLYSLNRSPSHRATGPKCNFFSLNLQRSPWRKKKALSPVGGRQGPVAQPTGDRRWARPTGAAGGLSPPPPRATGVPTPIKGLTLPFPPHLSPKIPPKIQKKREE